MTARTRDRWFEPVTEPLAPLEPHALALIFPEVTGAHFDELVADIKAHGLAEEIVTHEGKILDGRTRHKACLAAGVEPRYRPFELVTDFDGGPLDYVVSKNLTRRHLTTSQRAAIAADLADRKGESLPRDEKGRLQTAVGIPTLAEAAEKLNVSRDSAAVAAKVKKASPELHEEVKTGKTSLNKAEQAIDRRQARKNIPPAVERLDDFTMAPWVPSGKVDKYVKIFKDSIETYPVIEGEVIEGEVVESNTESPISDVPHSFDVIKARLGFRTPALCGRACWARGRRTKTS